MTNSPAIGYLLMLFAGSALAGINKVPGKLLRWIRNRVLFTVEITSANSAFPWMKQWLGTVADRTRYVAVEAIYADELSPGSRSSRKPTFCMWPRGACTFRHRGRRIVAWHEKESLQNSVECRETITLQFFGRATDVARQILSEAYELAHGIDGRITEIWILDGCEWRLADRKPARRIESVVLPLDIRDRVLDDARRFLRAGKWYADRGIPYRRGYLFHGPPGNGKSSLAMAIAGELQTDVNVLSLEGITDNGLIRALSQVPPGRIVLLEDVDAAWSEKRSSKYSITFSGLLNALDGAAARDGRILILTTNHLEKLDPALIRPGRADLHFLINHATREQAAEMFLRFFPERAGEALEFAEWGNCRSMASIQEELLNRSLPAPHTTTDVKLKAA